MPLNLLPVAVGSLILVAGGVIMTCRGLTRLRAARESEAWPQVFGKIRTVRMVYRQLGRNVRPVAAVTYEYTVSGETYAGNRVNTGGSATGVQASRVARTYVPRQRVRIAYDPDDPARSVLEPGLYPDITRQLLLGPVVVLAGVLIFIVQARA
ncbi:MAG: DUF3592 domain-containing protein [Anaerolineae bacterium]